VKPAFSADSGSGNDSRVSRASLSRSSITALVWSAVERWGGQLVALAVYMVLARMLGPDDFGLVALAGVYIAFVQVFVDQGLAAAIVQRSDLHSRHKDSAFWLSLVIGLVLAGFSILLASPIASLLGEPVLAELIPWLSLSIVFASLTSVQLGLLQRRLEFRPLAVRTLVATAVGGFVGVVMALNNAGVWSLVAYQLVSGGLRLILLWRSSDWRPGTEVSVRAFADLMPFSLSMLGVRLLELVNRQGDKLIIGLLLGPAALGLYALAYRLYKTLNMLLSGFVSEVALSSFSALQHEPELLRSAYYKASRVAALVAFPSFALTAGLAAIGVPWVLGDKWAASVPVLQWLALAGALECVLFFNANLMVALGKAHWRLGVASLNAVLNLVGFAVAARFGIEWVAMVYAVRAWLVAPLPYFLVGRLISFDVWRYVGALRVPTLAAALALATSYVAVRLHGGDNQLLWMVVAALTTALSTGFAVYWFDSALQRDLAFFGRVFSLPTKDRNKPGRDKRLMAGGFRVFSGISVLVLACGLVWVALGWAPQTRWQMGDRFVEREFEIETFDLYDLGLARIDEDQLLDAYTVNHSAAQSVFLGSGALTTLGAFGLGQDALFPSLESHSAPPQGDSPGLKIYRVRKQLHFMLSDAESLGLPLPLRLTVSMPWPLEIKRTANADIRYLSTVEGSSMSTLEVTLESGAHVSIVGSQDIVELPHTLTLSDPVWLPHVFIGHEGIPARNNPVELHWRDRHSMAWRDVDDDGDSDVFVGRGGVKGQLHNVTSEVSDELLIRTGLVAENAIKRLGLEKGTCPARQAAWVDADADDNMDLFVSCGRLAGGNHPDMLYLQDSGGNFTDVASAFDLDGGAPSVFRWFDLEQDGDSDLLVQHGTQIDLHRRVADGFELKTIHDGLLPGAAHIALGDIDEDGDLDALIARRSGSLVVVLDGASAQIFDASSFGLPDDIATAALVDVDNDGITEVHAVPGGIFERGSDGRFEATGELADTGRPGVLSGARCAWYDRDVDGRMDVICAIERYPGKIERIYRKGVQKLEHARYWTTHAAEVDSGTAHWLQIQLDAGPRNREGIGASVRFTANQQTYFGEVGMHEGSHHGQGHYRLYFGLGDVSELKQVEVIWPGGEIETFPLESIDRLVTLTRGKGRL